MFGLDASQTPTLRGLGGNIPLCRPPDPVHLPVPTKFCLGLPKAPPRWARNAQPEWRLVLETRAPAPSTTQRNNDCRGGRLAHFADGDLLLSKIPCVAASTASPRMVALGLFFTSARNLKLSPNAKNSPKLSQRRWFSSTNCCTCFGADPPAPVSKAHHHSLISRSRAFLQIPIHGGKRSVR